MRESDITPEVIALAKEIAEFWRMEIYEGCWYVQGSESNARLYQGGGLFIDGEKIQVFGVPIKIVSIPSISDCLEKLRELGYKYLFEYDCDGHWLRVYGGKEKYHSFEVDHQCEHLALLSALLEVLTKGKDK